MQNLSTVTYTQIQRLFYDLGIEKFVDNTYIFSVNLNLSESQLLHTNLGGCKGKDTFHNVNYSAVTIPLYKHKQVAHQISPLPMRVYIMLLLP